MAAWRPENPWWQNGLLTRKMVHSNSLCVLIPPPPPDSVVCRGENRRSRSTRNAQKRWMDLLSWILFGAGMLRKKVHTKSDGTSVSLVSSLSTPQLYFALMKQDLCSTIRIAAKHLSKNTFNNFKAGYATSLGRVLPRPTTSLKIWKREFRDRSGSWGYRGIRWRPGKERVPCILGKRWAILWSSPGREGCALLLEPGRWVFVNVISDWLLCFWLFNGRAYGGKVHAVRGIE